MNQNNKITKNSFSGGRDTDTNVAIVSPDRYQSAHNLDYIATGNFQGLQNVIGTTNLIQIGNDSTLVEIGAFACKFSINGILTYCNLYFTMSSATGTFNIWAYDTQNVVLYALYQETYAAGYYTTDRVVDAVNYPEGGIDHVYFADGFNELRQLTCSITTPWTANSLTAFDLALLRRGADGTIALSSISTGGSLLSGTYQFAYRMCNPTTKKFTKWSAITDPVHVYDSDNSNNPVYAGIGLPTTRKIVVTVTPSSTEIAALASLPYIQLGVIENIASTPAISVSLQQYTVFTGTSMNLTYQANTRVASVALDSFTIDPAQIQNAKTLRSSNNRLFIGNVNYVKLFMNSSFGSPAVSSGTIIAATSATIGSTQGDSYSQDSFSSQYIGYFRDEVYRFGLVYRDKYGNASYVSPLDMSGVTDNQIASGVKDMHFPARSFNKKYTLFNSNGYMQGLGLNLNLVNHPTWAASVEVVRVPRKNNIQFQSPIIPMMVVNGTGALKSYPSNLTTVAGTTTYNSSTNATSAQPMTAGQVLVPKNMFWPEGRDISKYSTDNGTTTNAGEVFLNNFPGTCTYSYAMLFPTPNMYGDTNPVVNDLSNAFIYTGAEKVDFIDQAILKLNYSQSLFPPNPAKTGYLIGDDINTGISGNFYAVFDGDYYYDSASSGKATTTAAAYSGTAVTGYQFYDNFAQSTPVGGFAVMDYPSLSTTGYAYGYQPNIQRSAVVALSGISLKDPTSYGGSFTNGTLNAYGAGGGTFIFNSSGPKYQSATALNNTYLAEPSTYGYVSDTGYCTAVDIVNVKLGLADNRYGDINSLLTYQSTGALHTFSTAEQSTLQSGGQVTVNLNVWGGDCFVSPHTFKICDSTYSVTNNKIPPIPGASLTKWNGAFFNGYNYPIALPVAVQNATQYITVVLESEYNGGVRDHDAITPLSPPVSPNGVPILNNSIVNTCRTPLSYRYNFNLSRSNYQKVFSTYLQFSFEQYEFDSRVAYSNIKIYNSDQSGFDIFNDADFYDLPEQPYAITALAVAADQLYAIQEKGIVYLPTSGRQVEETDSATLAINSGVVIGRPVIVSTGRGSQHLRGVVEIGNAIFIPDNKNKDVYLLSGTDLAILSQDNQTQMKAMYTSQFPGNAIKGVFDYVNEQYLLIMPTSVQIYYQTKSIWIGDYECTPFSGVYQRGVIYMTAFDGNSNSNLCVYSLYTGSPNVLFGNTVVPRVSFVVNPDEAFAKTFDVVMLDSSDQLSTANLQVIYDTSSNPSTINGLNLAVPNVENNYRIPLGKDQNGYRLRGMRMLVTAIWGTTLAQLKSIYTKYRYSKRTPF